MLTRAAALGKIPVHFFFKSRELHLKYAINSCNKMVD